MVSTVVGKTPGLQQPPNKGLQLTSTFASQGVLRPPCSLRMLAAETHVGGAEIQRNGPTTYRSPSCPEVDVGHGIFGEIRSGRT